MVRAVLLLLCIIMLGFFSDSARIDRFSTFELVIFCISKTVFSGNEDCYPDYPMIDFNFLLS